MRIFEITIWKYKTTVANIQNTILNIGIRKKVQILEMLFRKYRTTNANTRNTILNIQNVIPKIWNNYWQYTRYMLLFGIFEITKYTKFFCENMKYPLWIFEKTVMNILNTVINNQDCEYMKQYFDYRCSK